MLYNDREVEVEVRRLRNQPPPKWYLDEPDIIPEMEWFFKAFRELSTERQIGYTIGPIPESKIREYAREHGLDRDNLQLFQDMMRALDEAYRKWTIEDQEKKSQAVGDSPGGHGKTVTGKR